MAIQNYGRINEGRRKKLKKRIAGIVIIAIIVIAALFTIGILAGNTPEYKNRVSILEQNHALVEENEQLRAQLAAVQQQLDESSAYIASLPTETPAPDAAAPTAAPPVPTEALPVSPRSGQ